MPAYPSAVKTAAGTEPEATIPRPLECECGCGGCAPAADATAAAVISAA